MSAFLESLVAAVETKLPAVRYQDGGSRAEAAADIVRRHAIEYLGEQGGRDYWRCDGYHCSIRGECTCRDRAPLDPNGRKLCKHRLAAMFAHKMRQERGLVAILRGVQGERITLTVQVLFADNGRQYTLDRYRADGVETVLDYAERVRFTADELTAACRVAGWGMTDAPVKLPGYSHRYILRRGAEMAHSAAEMPLDDIERKAREARMSEIAALDAGEQNDEIMRRLPTEVQAAIYQKAGLSR